MLIYLFIYLLLLRLLLLFTKMNGSKKINGNTKTKQKHVENKLK